MCKFCKKIRKNEFSSQRKAAKQRFAEYFNATTEISRYLSYPSAFFNKTVSSRVTGEFQRCMMAYVNERKNRIRSFRWRYGGALPTSVRVISIPLSNKNRFLLFRMPFVTRKSNFSTNTPAYWLVIRVISVITAWICFYSPHRPNRFSSRFALSRITENSRLLMEPSFSWQRIAW